MVRAQWIGVLKAVEHVQVLGLMDQLPLPVDKRCSGSGCSSLGHFTRPLVVRETVTDMLGDDMVDEGGCVLLASLPPDDVRDCPERKCIVLLVIR